MKRTFLSIVAFGIFAAGIFAQTPNSESAAQFAQEFIRNNAAVFNQSATLRANTVNPSDRGVSNTPLYQTAQTSPTSLFVFTPTETEGFVMVAQNGDDYAVVGYSGKGGFNAADIPPQLRAMMDWYEDSLHITGTGAIHPAPTLRAAPAVPLLDQKGISLNQFHHEEVWDGWTGCMATACAQIMAYYQYPDQGIGSHCYTYNGKEICADFGNTTYNWNNPTDDDYKKLSFHVGIAMDMRYNNSASGSSPPSYDKIYNLQNYFGYAMQNYHPDIRECIDEGYPLYYSITGNPDDHAVVIDGYDDRGFWHYNFGWGGSHNGYYLNGNPIYTPADMGFKAWNYLYASILMLPPQSFAVAEQDSLALIDFYNSINRDLYDNNSNRTTWDFSQPVSSWQGISVWQGRVHVIDVATDLGFRATFEGGTGEPVAAHITESLGKLTDLRELKMTVANGYSTITLPQSIGQCTHLRRITMGGYGRCTGQIPASIGQCAHLEEIWLGGNGLVSLTGLTGNIPPEIGNCSNLRTLVLSDNQLTGSIPATIGNLTHLETLSLRFNQLTGTIPASFVNLTNLKSLEVADNQLSGNIPTVVTKIIRAVDLSNNQFSGEIPPSFFERGDLGSINLSSNQLSGALPAAIGNLTQLQSLNLSNNQLSGAVPEEIGNLANLRYLYLSDNQFTSLPETMSGLDNLYAVSLHHNLFTTLPRMAVHPMSSESRVTFDASYNLIESLPDFYFNAWKTVKAVNLSHNRLTGFPAGLHRVDDIETVNLSNNRIEKFPDDIGKISPNMMGLWLNDNEIQDDIPVSLLRHKTLSLEGGLRLENNFFTFENIPQIDIVYNRVNFQNPIPLKKTVYKVQMGDTLRIDVKDIAPFSRPDNIFHWGVWHDMAYSVEYFAKYVSGIGWRPFPDPTDPVLTLVANEETLKNRYFCYVTNPNFPLREYLETGAIDDGSWLFEGGEQNYAYKPYLFTETIELELASEAESFADQNSDVRALLSKNIGSGGMSDHTVTLVTPASARGAMQWEASADGQTWMDVSGTMSNAEIKANVQSITPRELKLFPQTTAFYRCRITDEGCDPIYSDEIKVNAYGKIVFDQTVSVTDSTSYVASADGDSISVTVPAGFHDGAFRLSIVKLNAPPLANGQPAGAIGSVYDVSVDFGTEFDMPLLISLQVANPIKDDADIDRYKAVYFDDANARWIEYETSFYNFGYNTIHFETDHLTKVASWILNEDRERYTDFYQYGRARVYYREDDLIYFRGYKPKTESWHTVEYPDFITDIAHYLENTMSAMESKGLPYVNSIRPRFYAYVKDNDATEGNITSKGMTYGYMYLDRSSTDNPNDLRSTLAHEYMHYLQSGFYAASNRNMFWMEANAVLADRIIYSESEIASCEGDQNLRNKPLSSKESIFNLLKRSWDYWDRYTNDKYGLGNREHCYQAGTFLHYMRTYREGAKLDPVALLKNTPTFGSWRSYLTKYIADNLSSTIGDEYDAYVKMLFSGEKPEFTLLSKNEFSSLHDLIYASFRDYPRDYNFFTYLKYKFEASDDTPETQTFGLTLPYLSSQAIVIDNRSDTKNIAISYKRLHAPANGHKVYFAQYDESSKVFNHTDITDSLTYSVLLTAWDLDHKNRNQAFILLVNKDNPSWGSSDFNASFEITATPLMDIENIVSLALEGAYFLPQGGEELVASAFKNFKKTVSTTVKMQDASTLLIHADYSYYYEDGNVLAFMITRRTVKHAQQIEYNFVTGEFKISQTRTESDLLDIYDFIKDENGHYQPVFVRTDTPPAKTEEWTAHLKGITPFNTMTGFRGMVMYDSQMAGAVARDQVVSATINGEAVDVSEVRRVSMVVKINN